VKVHPQHLLDRILRAGLRVHPSCSFRVIAVGLNHRHHIIDITTNTPSHACFRRNGRGLHAEERLIFRNPRSLSSIVIARVGRGGSFLPIDACDVCKRIATKRGISINRYIP